MAKDEDRYILLKIRRQFSKDEATNFLLAKLQEAKIEIGILKSEKDELAFLNQKKNQKTTLVQLKNTIHNLEKKIFELSQENNRLKKSLFNLK